MENEEKAKVILDYDKYQELLERVNDADKKILAVANKAYGKAKQEDAALIDILREKIASLEKKNSKFPITFLARFTQIIYSLSP